MVIRRILAVTAILALGCLVRAGARADASADAKKTIAAIYAKRDAAEQKKDIDGSMSAVTPDFVYVTKDGQKGDAATLKRQMTPLVSFMQSIKSKSAITKFVLKGKEAVATVKSHLEMLVMNPQTQAPQKVIADGLSEDLWTKTGKGWLQKKMVTKSQTATVDGKAIDTQVKLNGKSAKPAAAPKNKSARKTG